MNILFLEGDMSRRGGTERMTAFLSEQLCAEHRVSIASLHMAEPAVFFTLDSRVEHIDLHASSMAGIIRAVRRTIREKKSDVVINVDTGMGIYGICGALGTGARVITWENSNFCNDWGSKIFPYLRRFAARHSDAMVVLTERDRENYRSGIRGCAPVHVIPNPASPCENHYDSEAKLILSAGNFSPVKRFEWIPEIGKAVFQAHPDWKWVICGDGPARKRVGELVRQYGLEENILLPGAVKDMEEQYCQAAMYVMTSSVEGLPMVLLEAKAWGLPLVSFDIMTGPSDIIRDGVNGCLIPDEDKGAMTEQILKLIDSPELRRSFSEHAALDMEKFSRESVVAKWQELLKQN